MPLVERKLKIDTDGVPQDVRSFVREAERRIERFRQRTIIPGFVPSDFIMAYCVLRAVAGELPRSSLLVVVGPVAGSNCVLVAARPGRGWLEGWGFRDVTEGVTRWRWARALGGRPTAALGGRGRPEGNRPVLFRSGRVKRGRLPSWARSVSQLVPQPRSLCHLRRRGLV